MNLCKKFNIDDNSVQKNYQKSSKYRLYSNIINSKNLKDNRTFYSGDSYDSFKALEPFNNFKKVELKEQFQYLEDCVFTAYTNRT